jgi:aspartyl-tRNA(Asn)/glutamyl-tRNA(Gln) amidotransferase subunit A
MLGNINIKEKLQKLKSGEIKVVHNLKFYLDNIKKDNSKYNIILELHEKEALARAEELDKLSIDEKKKLKLFGLIFTIKPNILKIGFTANCSSKTLEKFVGTYTSDVVNLIEKEGGIVIGTASCDEFACGSLGTKSAFENPINPNSPNRVPGGTSSGCACSISANFCDISLGTDTGGSLRAPASNCHLIGIKPSYSRVSRFGLIDSAMSFDQIGPITKNIYEAELVMSVICKCSKKDAIMQDISYKKPGFDKNKKYKIGVVKNLVSLIQDDKIKKLFDETIEKLKKAGHTIVELTINKIEVGVSAYYPIVYTEFFSGTRKFDGIKYGEKIEKTCGEEVLRRILGGGEISKAEFVGEHYKKALKIREILSCEFDKAFSNCDFIMNPTFPTLPPKLDEKLTVEEEYAVDMFTVPCNLVGICSGVVPIETVEDREDNVNVGFQIMANKFCEDKMFEGMFAVENLKNEN